jgi:putative transposase
LKVERDWLKKTVASSLEAKRQLMEPDHAPLSLRRPCAWRGWARTSLYAQPAPERAEDLPRRRWLDEPYPATPCDGMRRMTAWLGSQGHGVTHTRVGRLRRELGLEAIDPQPRWSRAAAGHAIYPYLLRGTTIAHGNQVWRTAITCMRLHSGFVSWVAGRDWLRRSVRSWAVSNTMDVSCCLQALEQALGRAQPEIFGIGESWNRKPG